MDSFFKRLFGKQPSQADQKDKPKGKQAGVSEEFNPTEAAYDPQLRLKRGLRALFPHLPATPGLPPSTNADADEGER